MKDLLWVLLLGSTLLTGCSTIAPPNSSISTSQVVNEEPTPTVTIKALDSSIPLGTSFPIVVNLENAPVNQQVEFELVNGDIVPSTSRVTTSTDANGQATISLTGRSTKPELNALFARAYMEDGSKYIGQLYVNFEVPPTPNLDGQNAGLAAQAESSDGEPTTFDAYVQNLPTVTSLEELDASSAQGTPGVRVQNVRFPEADGSLGEPIDALDFSSGQQTILATQPSGSCPLSPTDIYLKTTVDGVVTPFPAGTKVFISGPGTTPDKTTYTDASGKITFSYGCDQSVFVRVMGQTNDDLQMVSGNHDDGFPLWIWSKTLKPYSGLLSSEGLSGESVQFATSSTNSTALTTQGVFITVSKVRYWETTTHNLYSQAQFPLRVLYPDTAFWHVTSYAVYGKIYLKGGSDSEDIWHEFGHEVQYIRALGPSSYRYYFNQTAGGTDTIPACAGYANGWVPWDSQENCEAMIEGFADWFGRVYTSVAQTQTRNYEYAALGADLGDSVPGRVAQFLWDITDKASSNQPVRDTDTDEVAVSDITIGPRYARVARLVHLQPTNRDFAWVWANRVKTLRPADQIPFYCKVAKRNTITVPAAGC